MNHEQYNHRKQIKLTWTIEDVQAERPDLNDEQAEKVIETINNEVYFTMGGVLSTICKYADKLFPRVENIK